jgi:hypothetical protein
MDFPEEHNREEVVVKETRSYSGAWAAVAVVIALGAALAAYAYGNRQQAAVAQLLSHQANMSATIDQLQNQLSDATTKINNLAAARTAPPVQAGVTTGTRRAANDPRWKKVQSQLDEQKQMLTDQQNAITQTRTDLEGNIASSHDELNGSIARTHDELVALEQRGERNYDEFDLAKGKNNRFSRTGPISLELKKADPKHKHYDLALLIDDNQIQKKNVDLYEPIWLRNSTDAQPLEIVVNKIDKDRIHGYVSSPKYGQVRPASSASAPVGSTPQSQ